MERDQRQLESDADQDHAGADKGEQIAPLPGRCGQSGQLEQVHGPRVCVDERHSKQQQSAGRGGRDQVLDARLDVDLPGAAVGDQDIQRHAQQLKPDEEGHEVRA